MKTKHTPGPWQYAYTGDGHEITMPGFNDDVSKDCARFIEWNHLIEPDQSEQFSEAEANAKLIAAAPELLEALILARTFILKNGINYENADQYNLINNAIKKATE